ENRLNNPSTPDRDGTFYFGVTSRLTMKAQSVKVGSGIISPGNCFRPGPGLFLTKKRCCSK
ncbi:MAG: hypothetical protein ACLFS7_05655, partial [Desulfosudaceae bacterium]